ncbi:hypothetical protein [Streptomyces sp. AC495_CC817]|uniref:hypothetical protein n=1 Tax=Streptomyces sp. AC495_CC817 TaxID=2823900 RepID=UPI001C254F61|nr:hypothetical protein [Streptomyces sp. AC495_CC817]
MYEHPYFSYQITRYEHEELSRRAERRRFIEEHADQIVPREAGPLRRLLGRLGRTTAVAPARTAPCEPVAAR